MDTQEYTKKVKINNQEFFEITSQIEKLRDEIAELQDKQKLLIERRNVLDDMHTKYITSQMASR